MHPRTPKTIRPVPDVSHLIQTDQMPLERQMVLCRADKDGWRHLRLVVAQVQAFFAQHIVSVLLLMSTSAGLASWLMG